MGASYVNEAGQARRQSLRVNICASYAISPLQGRKRFWTGGDTVDSYGKRQKGKGSRGGRRGGRQGGRGMPHYEAPCLGFDTEALC